MVSRTGCARWLLRGKCLAATWSACRASAALASRTACWIQMIAAQSRDRLPSTCRSVWRRGLANWIRYGRGGGSATLRLAKKTISFVLHRFNLRLMAAAHACRLSISFSHTRRGRSRAQHVRDREAEIETAKNGRLVHWRRSKGEARRAEPTFGLCFRAKASKEANGEARRAEPKSPFLVASDQKRKIIALVVSPYGVSKGTNTSHCRRLSSFEP